MLVRRRDVCGGIHIPICQFHAAAFCQIRFAKRAVIGLWFMNLRIGLLLLALIL